MCCEGAIVMEAAFCINFLDDSSVICLVILLLASAHRSNFMDDRSSQETIRRNEFQVSLHERMEGRGTTTT